MLCTQDEEGLLLCFSPWWRKYGKLVFACGQNDFHMAACLPWYALHFVTNSPHNTPDQLSAIPTTQHRFTPHTTGQKIIAVCHGNIMTALRVRLERYLSLPPFLPPLLHSFTLAAHSPSSFHSSPSVSSLPHSMSQSRYQELENSKSTFEKIHHCQIFHYTRRDPFTGVWGGVV